MVFKIPQFNAIVQQVCQFIYIMPVTIYMSKIFDYINTLVDILSSVSQVIIYSYDHTLNLNSKLLQAVFERYMIFNIVSIVHFKFITTNMKLQSVTDISIKNSTKSDMTILQEIQYIFIILVSTSNYVTLNNNCIWSQESLQMVPIGSKE